MQEHKRIKAVVFWLLLVASDTIAQLLLKLGAVRTASSGWKISYLIFVGYSFYVVSFIAWMQILKTTRLSIALSAASILYITVAIASHFLIGEAITIHIIIGTILISIGVFLLGFSDGNTQASKEENRE